MYTYNSIGMATIATTSYLQGFTEVFCWGRGEGGMARHEAIMLQNLPIMLCCNSFKNVPIMLSSLPIMLPLCPVFLNSKNKGGAISTVHLTIVDCLGHSGESKLFIATVVTQLPFKTETL